MEFNKAVLIAVYVILGIYLLFRLLYKKDRFQQEYEDLYNKTLNSEDYKVKGQYEK